MSKNLKIVKVIGLIGLLIILFYFFPSIKARFDKGVHEIEMTAYELKYAPQSSLASGRTVLFNNEIYYINDSDQGNIYKMDVSGNNHVKISDDYVSEMCISDDKIYFISETEGLFRMDINGSNKFKLDEAAMGNLTIQDNWVYYLANIKIEPKEKKADLKLSSIYANYIYKMTTDGKSITRIGNICSREFVIDNEWIYFIEDSPRDIFDTSFMKVALDEKVAENEIYKKVYRIKTTGDELYDLDIRTYSGISTSQGWLYFFDIDKHLKKLRFLNGDTQIINMLPESGDKIKVVKNDLYFIQSVESSKGLYGWNFKSALYKVKTDGTNFEKICEDDEIQNYDIVGNSIFYNTISVKGVMIYKTFVLPTSGGKKQLFIYDYY
jgi:sorbitol-specific phosphotransferase system component IIA